MHNYYENFENIQSKTHKQNDMSVYLNQESRAKVIALCEKLLYSLQKHLPEPFALCPKCASSGYNVHYEHFTNSQLYSLRHVLECALKRRGHCSLKDLYKIQRDYGINVPDLRIFSEPNRFKGNQLCEHSWCKHTLNSYLQNLSRSNSPKDNSLLFLPRERFSLFKENKNYNSNILWRSGSQRLQQMKEIFVLSGGHITPKITSPNRISNENPPIHLEAKQKIEKEFRNSSRRKNLKKSENTSQVASSPIFKPLNKSTFSQVTSLNHLNINEEQNAQSRIQLEHIKNIQKSADEIKKVLAELLQNVKPSIVNESEETTNDKMFTESTKVLNHKEAVACQYLSTLKESTHDITEGLEPLKSRELSKYENKKNNQIELRNPNIIDRTLISANNKNSHNQINKHGNSMDTICSKFNNRLEHIPRCENKIVQTSLFNNNIPNNIFVSDMENNSQTVLKILIFGKSMEKPSKNSVDYILKNELHNKKEYETPKLNIPDKQSQSLSILTEQNNSIYAHKLLSEKSSTSRTLTTNISVKPLTDSQIGLSAIKSKLMSAIEEQTELKYANKPLSKLNSTCINKISRSEISRYDKKSNLMPILAEQIESEETNSPFRKSMSQISGSNMSQKRKETRTNKPVNSEPSNLDESSISTNSYCYSNYEHQYKDGNTKLNTFSKQSSIDSRICYPKVSYLQSISKPITEEKQGKLRNPRANRQYFEVDWCTGLKGKKKEENYRKSEPKISYSQPNEERNELENTQIVIENADGLVPLNNSTTRSEYIKQDNCDRKNCRSRQLSFFDEKSGEKDKMNMQANKLTNYELRQIVGNNESTNSMSSYKSKFDMYLSGSEDASESTQGQERKRKYTKQLEKLKSYEQYNNSQSQNEQLGKERVSNRDLGSEFHMKQQQLIIESSSGDKDPMHTRRQTRKTKRSHGGYNRTSSSEVSIQGHYSPQQRSKRKPFKGTCGCAFEDRQPNRRNESESSNSHSQLPLSSMITASENTESNDFFKFHTNCFRKFKANCKSCAIQSKFESDFLGFDRISNANQSKRMVLRESSNRKSTKMKIAKDQERKYNYTDIQTLTTDLTLDNAIIESGHSMKSRENHIFPKVRNLQTDMTSSDVHLFATSFTIRENKHTSRQRNAGEHKNILMQSAVKSKYVEVDTFSHLFANLDNTCSAQSMNPTRPSKRICENVLDLQRPCMSNKVKPKFFHQIKENESQFPKLFRPKNSHGNKSLSELRKNENHKKTPKGGLSKIKISKFKHSGQKTERDLLVSRMASSPMPVYIKRVNEQTISVMSTHSIQQLNSKSSAINVSDLKTQPSYKMRNQHFTDRQNFAKKKQQTLTDIAKRFQKEMKKVKKSAPRIMTPTSSNVSIRKKHDTEFSIMDFFPSKNAPHRTLSKSFSKNKILKEKIMRHNYNSKIGKSTEHTRFPIKASKNQKKFTEEEKEKLLACDNCKDNLATLSHKSRNQAASLYAPEESRSLQSNASAANSSRLKTANTCVSLAYSKNLLTKCGRNLIQQEPLSKQRIFGGSGTISEESSDSNEKIHTRKTNKRNRIVNDFSKCDSDCSGWESEYEAEVTSRSKQMRKRANTLDNIPFENNSTDISSAELFQHQRETQWTDKTGKKVFETQERSEMFRRNTKEKSVYSEIIATRLRQASNKKLELNANKGKFKANLKSAHTVTNRRTETVNPVNNVQNFVDNHVCSNQRLIIKAHECDENYTHFRDPNISRQNKSVQTRMDSAKTRLIHRSTSIQYFDQATSVSPGEFKKNAKALAYNDNATSIETMGFQFKDATTSFDNNAAIGKAATSDRETLGSNPSSNTFSNNKTSSTDYEDFDISSDKFRRLKFNTNSENKKSTTSEKMDNNSDKSPFQQNNSHKNLEEVKNTAIETAGSSNSVFDSRYLYQGKNLKTTSDEDSYSSTSDESKISENNLKSKGNEQEVAFAQHKDSNNLIHSANRNRIQISKPGISTKEGTSTVSPIRDDYTSSKLYAKQSFDKEPSTSRATENIKLNALKIQNKKSKGYEEAVNSYRAQNENEKRRAEPKPKNTPNPVFQIKSWFRPFRGTIADLERKESKEFTELLGDLFHPFVNKQQREDLELRREWKTTERRIKTARDRYAREHRAVERKRARKRQEQIDARRSLLDPENLPGKNQNPKT